MKRLIAVALTALVVPATAAAHQRHHHPARLLCTVAHRHHHRTLRCIAYHPAKPPVVTPAVTPSAAPEAEDPTPQTMTVVEQRIEELELVTLEDERTELEPREREAEEALPIPLCTPAIEATDESCEEPAPPS